MSNRALAARAVFEHQRALVARHAHDRVRAALAHGHRVEQRQASGVERDHVALLALVAPDLLGREAGFFERHLAQVERGALAGAVHQLGERVADAAGAHVVDREDRVVRARAASNG